jgi:hypothetical protein
MGFNRRKLEANRKAKADAEAAATSGRRISHRHSERAPSPAMPLLFAPTIGAALTARHHFLWVYCPACRTTRDIDLRTLDLHRDAAVTSVIPSLSCRSCRPHAPFTELVRLSNISIADEMRIEHTRRVLGD